jgi:hypothetical protein
VGLTAMGELTMVVLAVGVYTGFMHYGLKGYICLDYGYMVNGCMD